MINSKNCADVYTSIDVAASIQWIENNTILSFVSVFDDDGLVEFFRHKYGGLAGRAKRVHHDIIRKYVELLLFFALYVRFASQTDPGSDFSDPRKDMIGVEQCADRLMRRALRTLVAMNLETS